MNKSLKKLCKTAQTDITRGLHYFIDFTNTQDFFEYKNDFKNQNKLVNAGGFDGKGLYFMPCDLCSMEDVITPWGRGFIIPNLVRRYSDINPGIDDFF